MQGPDMLMNISTLTACSWANIFPLEVNQRTRRISVSSDPPKRKLHHVWLVLAFLHSFYLFGSFLGSVYEYWYTGETYGLAMNFIPFIASVTLPTWNWTLFIEWPKLQEDIFNGLSFNQTGWLHKNLLFYCNGFQPVMSQVEVKGSGGGGASAATGARRSVQLTLAGEGLGSLKTTTDGKMKRGQMLKDFLKYLPIYFMPILLTPTLCYWMMDRVPFSCINLIPDSYYYCRSLSLVVDMGCVGLDTLVLLFWMATGYYFCLITLSFFEAFNGEIEELSQKLRFPNVTAEGITKVTGKLRILILKLQRFRQVTNYIAFTCKLCSLLLTIFSVGISFQLLSNGQYSLSIACGIMGVVSAGVYSVLDTTILMPTKIEQVKKRIVDISHLHHYGTSRSSSSSSSSSSFSRRTQKEFQIMVKSVSSKELKIRQLIKYRRNSSQTCLSYIVLQAVNLQSALL